MGEQEGPGGNATEEPLREKRPRKFKLMPLLCPANFAASTFSAKRVVPSRPDSPFIALARDYPDRWELAPSSLNFDEHSERALRNLRRRKERAEWHRPDGPSGPADVLLRLGDALTASDLLDLDFLRKGAALLGADQAFVAVPTRESMVLSADFALVAQFALAHLEDPEPDEYAIGAQIFRSNANGLELIGSAARPGATAAARAETSAPERKPQPASETGTQTSLAFDTPIDEGEDESLGYMPVGLEIGSPDGSTMILLALTEPSLESAEEKIRILLERRLQRYAAKPSFGGILWLVLNPETIEANASNQAKLEQILLRTNAELERRGVITVSGNPIRVGGGIGHPGAGGPSRSRQVQAQRSRGMGSAAKAAAREAQAAEDEAHRPAVAEEPPATQRHELALIAGGVFAIGAVSARFVLAFDRLGASSLLQLSTLAPGACLIALLLAIRGVAYARFVLLGFSVASLVWSMIRSNAILAAGAPTALLAVALGSGLGFAAATLLLAIGRPRSQSASPRRGSRRQRPLGLALGLVLSLVPGLADVPQCMDRKGSPRIASCRALDTTACAKVPGCRVHSPRCAIDCSTGFGDSCPAACEESDGRCQPLACSWSIHTNVLGQSKRTCEPSGLCVEQADQCVEGCSTLSTREACRGRAFCGFTECEGTPAVACAAFPAAECPTGLCDLRGY